LRSFLRPLCKCGRAFEIARSLSVYAEKLDLDPQQLAALEQRVSLFETLKRKYGGSIVDVIAFGEARRRTDAEN